MNESAVLNRMDIVRRVNASNGNLTGTLTFAGSCPVQVSTGFANHFRFMYGDPRKMAEVLREIADTLLQCDHIGFDANNHPVQCTTPGTVRRKYSRAAETYTPAMTLCDDHFFGKPQKPVTESKSELQTVSV